MADIKYVLRDTSGQRMYLGESGLIPDIDRAKRFESIEEASAASRVHDESEWTIVVVADV